MPRTLRLVTTDADDAADQPTTPAEEPAAEETPAALPFPKGGVFAVQAVPSDPGEALSDPVRDAELALNAMQASLDQLRTLGKAEAQSPLPFPRFLPDRDPDRPSAA